MTWINGERKNPMYSNMDICMLRFSQHLPLQSHIRILIHNFSLILFRVSTPGIILAGISFLVMRCSVDGFNLLTVFKVEVDSEGGLVNILFPIGI